MPHCSASHFRVHLVAIVIAGLGLAGCGKSADPGSAATPPVPAPAPVRVATAPLPQLKDVLDTTSGHVIGISYPAALSKYPGLATQAQRFADEARARVLQAEKQRRPKAGEGPYELSLEFQLKHESAEMVVLAVDGSSFTGGTSGTPLIQRWVWLPGTARQLTVADLFPAPDSWKRIAADVREQLTTDLAHRLDSDDVPPADRRELMKSASVMIDEGTGPKAENFAVFEPVFDGDGRISALRFVFPPYQVGAYTEGMHAVEIPSARLIADVAPAYRHLFQATG